MIGRRRSYLIARLQYRLLGINLFYLSVIVFIFLVAIFAPVILSLYGASSFENSARAATEFLSLHRRIWPALPVAFILISIHSILVSHRIAGPLYRFRKVFDAIGNGDLLVRAGVRKRDYLRRESGEIDRMVDALAAKVARIAATTRELRSAGEGLRATLSGGGGPGADEAWSRFEAKLSRLERIVARFRLPEAEIEAENLETEMPVPAGVDAREHPDGAVPS